MAASTSSRDVQHAETDVCWICLEEGCSDSPLNAPCTCPRLVHKTCLARWQLQSAGRREERFCRFCSSQLPDWRNTLSQGVDMQVPPVMTVMHQGQVYVIPVQPGPHGLEQFQENIRKIFGYDHQVEINLSFGCTVPGSEGDMLTLEGCAAFDAAVHCAAVSAGLLANRNKRKRDSPTSSLPASPGPAAAAGREAAPSGAAAAGAAAAPGGAGASHSGGSSSSQAEDANAQEPPQQRRRAVTRQAANKHSAAASAAASNTSRMTLRHATR